MGRDSGRPPPSRSDVNILDISFSLLAHQSQSLTISLLHAFPIYSPPLHPSPTSSPPLPPPECGPRSFLAQMNASTLERSFLLGPPPPRGVTHTVANQLSEMQCPSSHSPHWKAQFLDYKALCDSVPTSVSRVSLISHPFCRLPWPSVPHTLQFLSFSLYAMFFVVCESVCKLVPLPRTYFFYFPSE